jgi:cell division transport system permease protein
MNQTGKASSKRSTPSYFMSILGVSLVLVILGVLGWVFLNFQKAGNALRENIQMHAWLNSNRKKDVDSVISYLQAKPFLKNIEYVDKAKAKEIYNKTEDPNWEKIITENPLPESIDFYAQSEFVNRDSLDRLSTELTTMFPTVVGSVQYPKEIVGNLNSTAKKIGLILVIVAAVLSISVIALIDNTIRLAMFSNRFLIKTMQMVGATRDFIAKPMNIRAIINGLISAGIAIAVIITLIYVGETLLPELKAIRDIKLLSILFLSIIVLGVGISWYSTHRSIMKYLKMKLDDLY